MAHEYDDEKPEMAAARKEVEKSIGSHPLANYLTLVGHDAKEAKEAAREIREDLKMLSASVNRLTVAIAGDPAYGSKGLVSEVAAIRDKANQTAKELKELKDRGKGGIWIVSTMAAFWGVLGAIVTFWIKR